jgi:hypothetical protein
MLLYPFESHQPSDFIVSLQLENVRQPIFWHPEYTLTPLRTFVYPQQVRILTDVSTLPMPSVLRPYCASPFPQLYICTWI